MKHWYIKVTADFAKKNQAATYGACTLYIATTTTGQNVVSANAPNQFPDLFTPADFVGKPIQLGPEDIQQPEITSPL